MFSLVLIVFLLVASITLPPVQNRLVFLAKTIVAGELGLKMEIGAVDFGLFRWAILRDVVVYDKQNVPFLQVKSIDIELIDFSFRRFYDNQDTLQTLKVGRIDLQQPEFYLYKTCEGKMNLSDLFPPQKEDTIKKPSAPLKIDIDVPEIFIEKGKFTFRDSSKNDMSIFQPKRMNFANLQIEDLNLLANIKRYNTNRLDINVKNLSLKETYSGFALQRLAFQLISDPEAVYDEKGNCVEEGVLKLNNLAVEAGKSKVYLNARFPDNTLESLLGGENGSHFYANVSKSSFELDILDHFTNPIPARGFIRSVQGEVSGDFQTLFGKNIHAIYDEEMIVDADIGLYNFTEGDKLFLDIKMRKGLVSGNALFRLLPDVKLPTFIHNVPTSTVVANFIGSPFDFQVAGTIESGLGFVQTDVHIQVPPSESKKEVTYEGTLLTKNLQFNKIGIVPNFGISNDIAFNGKIKGEGGDWSKLVVSTESRLTGIDVVGFKGDSVYGKIHLQDKHIVGYIRAHDGDSHFDGNVDINLANENNPKYKIDGKALNISLKKYKVLDQDIILSGLVKADLQGKDAKTITGTAQARELVVNYDGATHFQGDADVDLMDNSQPKYKITGKISNFNLKKFKLLEQEIIISSQVQVDLQGKDIEVITGDAKLQQMVLTYIKNDTMKTLKVSDIFLTAKHPNSDSTIFTLRSSLGNADISGHFKLKQTIDDVRNFITELQMYFTNNDSAIKAYYVQKPVNNTKRGFYLYAQAGNELNRLFTFLQQPVFIADTSVMRLDIDFGISNALTLHFNGDSVIYDSIRIHKPILAVKLSKDSYKNTITLKDTSKSSLVWISPQLIVENNELYVNTSENTANITLHSKQLNKDSSYNTLNLQADTKFSLDGHVETSLDTAVTVVHYIGYDWRISGNNRISYYKGDIQMDSLRIKTDSISLSKDKKIGKQSIIAVGSISKNPADKLTVVASNFELPVVSTLYALGFDLEGRANIQVDLYDLFKSPKIVANGIVKKVGINGLNYGDLYIDGKLKELSDKLALNASLINNLDTLLSLKGNYDFRSIVNPLDFKLSTQTSAIPLAFLNPFIENVVYDVKGALQLQMLNISGNFDNPVVKGAGKFVDAEFGVDFFKTKYRFNGDIVFDKDLINIKKLLLFDQNKHTAEFYGNIRHKSFKQFDFDLQLENIHDFFLMDLKKGDNSAFYGQIYIKDGLASITGDLAQLTVNAFGVTGKNTLLKIPLYDEGTISTPDFITLIDKNVRKNKIVASGGIKLDLNINIQATQEAEAELIFDEKIGDIMRGRGEGTINITLNPQGDFMMYGTYELTDGAYLFTSQNLVNKDFKVKPGGKITWNGDATEAQMDINAYYEIKQANAKALLNYEGNVYVKTHVVMRLQGGLMQPIITPNIEFPDLERSGNSAQIASELNAKKKSFEFDEQELNKQVISLLIWNQFSPNSLVDVGGTNNNIGNLATTSISEFISNQVNYLLSKSMSDKVNVSFSTSNLQDINMAISAKLFNDRVTVERDGAIVSNNTNLSIGNINVITKILPAPNDTTAINNPHSGELTLEVFNRNSIGTQITNGNQVGAGVFYKRDFDKLSDIFAWGKRRKVKTKR